MLLRFSAENFSSLRDEQELSMVALDEHPDLAVFDVPQSKLKVLPAVGIFGPNGSGKSAVIKAIAFATSAVIESQQLWLPEESIPRWPFRLDDVSRARPSRFVFEFVTGGVRHEYGFSLDDSRIHEEWLYTWPRGRQATLFERDGDAVEFGSSLGGQKAVIAESMRENCLFLSTAAALNHPRLRAVAAWFGTWSQVRHDPFPPSKPFDDEVLSLLRYADIGIVGMAMVERDESELGLSARSRRSMERIRRSNGRSGAPDGLAGPRPELVHRAENDSGGEPLPWSWESSGTQTWAHLALRASRCLSSGTIMVVDDLGGDLHPSLTAQLLGLFQTPQTNPHGAQLIFCGHDVSLLGKQVEHRLRRDQVCLTEKGRTGATKVYPLTEYGRVRDGVDDVEGRYLQGRYGAVPFFDQDLLPEFAENAARHEG